tara:strand:- start:1354 stop:3153 length:1800 start_codon:yes stop_codon:yes gene_type:complete
MAKKIVPVDYTSSDFERIKKDLVNYAKRYYPTTFKDFNEVSFGSLMMDLVSYVGDNLSFYLDYNANESFLNTSLEYDNVIAHARQLGYKHSPIRSSVGIVDIYMPVPAEAVNVGPDIRYLPKLLRGTVFSTDAGSTFTLTEDVEFFAPSVEVVGDEVSADGSMTTYYVLKAPGKVVSGEDRQATIEVGDYKRFLKLKVPGNNISQIVSVFDLSGNEYYEVDYLSQNVVYRPIVNRSEQNLSNNSPSVMKPFPVPRRFVVEREGRDLFLIFGYGSESEIKNNAVADPSEVVLDVLGKNYISEANFDPSKLMSTDKFGVSPVNTDLIVTYRVNNDENVNAAAGTINTIVTPLIEFRNPQNLEASKMTFITDNMEVYNESPINGDLSIPTTQEIKHRAYGLFATQGRAVTLQDYISAAYAMPSTFGSVKRAAIYRDDNDLTRNMNMFVISEDSSGNFEQPSTVLKDNLKTWLNSVRMVNDSVDILNASVLNLGIEFEIIAKQDVNKHATFNLAKEEIFRELNEVKPEIGEPFHVTEIFKILKDVPEILDVVNVKITSKTGADYSSFSYSIEDNLSPEGRVVYIPQDCVWEIKFKSDITGAVR